MRTETSPRLDNDSQLLSGSRGREVAEQVELPSAQDLRTDAAGGGCFPTERLAGSVGSFSVLLKCSVWELPGHI